MKAIAIYKTKEGYGYRPHEFDWRVGDRIFAKDGKQFQRIIKIVPADAEIVDFLRRTMNKCKMYSGEGKTKLKVVSGELVLETKKFINDVTGEGYFMRAISHLPEYKF